MKRKSKWLILRPTQHYIDMFWPIALLAMVVVMPGLIKKIYQEVKSNDR